MPTSPQQVILYGDSLILLGVRAALARRSDLEVYWLDPTQETPLDTILARCPAVFIFDLAAVPPDFQLALLQQPGLRLVGIEPETHRAVVWSGRQERAVVAADLLDVVYESGTPG
jgi:hypothetical protein